MASSAVAGHTEPDVPPGMVPPPGARSKGNSWKVLWELYFIKYKVHFDESISLIHIKILRCGYCYKARENHWSCFPEQDNFLYDLTAHFHYGSASINVIKYFKYILESYSD